MTAWNPRGCVLRVFFAAAVLVSGCATQLAPAYDQRILDGLTEANVEAMTLFAAFSEGAPKSRFTQYQDRYDKLIGTLDSLAMQIAARPTPEIPAALAAAVSKHAIDLSEPPVEPVQGMSRTIRTMRQIHSGPGLTATEVEGMRRGWAIYADQALTYEAYLNR